MRVRVNVTCDEARDPVADPRDATPAWDVRHGAAEACVLDVHCPAVDGKAPPLTVAVEHSDDGHDWTTALTLATAPLTAGQVHALGGDTGATILGVYVRLHVQFASGTTLALTPR